MSEELFKISMSATIITAMYQRIYNLSLADMEDDTEYLELIEKLKKYVNVEMKYYNELSDNDIKTYFDLIKNMTRFNNTIDGRIYSRMNDTKKKYEGNPVIDNNILLSSIIASKLTIDILKNVHEKISNMTSNDEMNDDDINLLMLYEKRYKFHYLTSNFFIEKLSLEYGFDIEKIPAYSYDKVEEKFNIRFIDNVQNNFCNYAIASLDELADLKSDNKYLLVYTKLFEIARIEAMLPYLNLDSLNKLSLYISNHNTKYDSNSALIKVRKIIDKRKEEFQ